MEERKPDIKKGILHRVQVLYVLFFIIGLMIVGKILYLQYGPKSGRLRSEVFRYGCLPRPDED